MRGAYKNADGEYEGHAWVCDGGIQNGTLRVITFNGSLPEGASRKYNDCQLLTSLFHYNWGWNGNCNGYFKGDVFDTSKAEIYDNADGNTMQYDFRYNVEFFVIYND